MEELPPAAPLEALISSPIGDYVVGKKFEDNLISLGFSRIVGIDEAGRGPLAGPVVAAAVSLDPDNIPNGLNDSKKLTAAKREMLFEQILNNCHVGIASVNAITIDRINIRQSTLMCMVRAVNALALEADWILIDGREIPDTLKGYASAIIKGDGRSISIAAASIVAKVTRDRMMSEAAITWPEYGFASHKGYGTKAHIAAINKHGPCPIHRISFAPISQK